MDLLLLFLCAAIVNFTLVLLLYCIAIFRGSWRTDPIGKISLCRTFDIWSKPLCNGTRIDAYSGLPSAVWLSATHSHTGTHTRATCDRKKSKLTRNVLQCVCARGCASTMSHSHTRAIDWNHYRWQRVASFDTWIAESVRVDGRRCVCEWACSIYNCAYLQTNRKNEETKKYARTRARRLNTSHFHRPFASQTPTATEKPFKW